MDIKRYIGILLHWLWLVAITTVVCGGLALLLALNTTPEYEASTTIIVTQSSANNSQSYNDILTSERLALTYTRLLTASPLLNEVIKNLGLQTTAELLSRQISVAVVRDTQLIDITVTDTNAQRAALIANNITDVFRKQTEEAQSSRYGTSEQNIQSEIADAQANINQTQASYDALGSPASAANQAEAARLQNLLAQYRSSLSTLTASLEQVRLANAQNSDLVSSVEPAIAPLQPVRPRPIQNLLTGCLLGLLLGLAFVAVREYLDDTAKSSDSVASELKLPALGAIALINGAAEKERVVSVAQTRSPIAEAYRVVAANIQFAEIDHPVKAMLVNSGNPSEGKTLSATNIAAVSAEMGKRVIIIDCDLRKPTLHRYFGLTNSFGVSNALLDRKGTAIDYIQQTGIKNLCMMASGPIPPNPAELCGSQRMHELVEELKTLSDLVIIDSPPCLVVADASLLAKTVDAILLVVRSGYTQVSNLRKSRDQLSQAGTRMLGFVLNRTSSRLGGYYYYYYGETTEPTWFDKLLGRSSANGRRKGRSRTSHQETTTPTTTSPS